MLLAVGLLIGTNAWAEWTEVNSREAFEEALEDATTTEALSTHNPLQIKLTGDITLNNPVKIGTVNMISDSLSLEIDLNGQVLTSNAKYGFILSHGVLKFINTNPGNDPDEIQGKVSHTGEKSAIVVTGSTLKNVDPSVDAAKYFSHLIIGENVVIDHSNGYNAAIIVDEISSKIDYEMGMDYYTNVYVQNTSDYYNKGIANGVRIDIYGTVNSTKYGVQANGYLGNTGWFVEKTGSPIPAGGIAPAVRDTKVPADYKIMNGDDNYSPYIYIHDGARITVPASASEEKKPTAIYAGGFARWLIDKNSQRQVGTA